MKMLRSNFQSLTIVMVVALFSLDAQAITVVNNFVSGPDTDILCRNNPNPLLVQNCWTAGTGNSNNFRIQVQGNTDADGLLAMALDPGAFGSILGDLTELYKVKSSDSTIGSDPAGEAGTLQDLYDTTFDFALNDTRDGYTGATIKNPDAISGGCSVECFLVVTGGKNSPAAYLFNLALGWDPLGANGGQPVANGIPSWNGLMDLTLANFWSNDKNSSVAYIAIYGNLISANASATLSAVPAPATFWLFGTALLGFIGLSRSTRV
jgi:hypothetical protein